MKDTKYMLSCDVEGANPSPELSAAIDNVIAESNVRDLAREDVVMLLQGHTFWPYRGGHHVAIVQGSERLATFVSDHPDWR